jgi:branched-chain amino acid transport system substrate-binding protein
MAASAVWAETPVVGVFLPLTGQNAVIGHVQENAMLLALEDVNRNVGPGGEPVLALDIRDAKDRPRDARGIVRHFITDKQYPLIIGGGVSGVVWSAAHLCQRDRTPFIVITGSEDRITSEGLTFVFRVAPPRSLYSTASIQFARTAILPEKVALVMEMSGFGDSMGDAVRASAQEEGWEVVFDGAFGFGSLDIAGIIEGIDDSGADTIFLTAFPPDAGKIMRELVRAFPRMAIINLVPSSAAAGAFLSCGKGCRGVFCSSLWWAGEGGAASSFRARFRERYGMEPDYHGAQAYAAVVAASAALRGVDPSNRHEVALSLKRTRIGTPMGLVSFDDWGPFLNQNRPPTYLLQWSGDRFEVVWPKGFRTAEPIGRWKGER